MLPPLMWPQGWIVKIEISIFKSHLESLSQLMNLAEVVLVASVFHELSQPITNTDLNFILSSEVINKKCCIKIGEILNKIREVVKFYESYLYINIIFKTQSI